MPITASGVLMLDSPIDPSNERKTILAVDDNLYTLTIVQQTLERADYKVLTAISGAEGLQIINRSGLPHLAIVDYHMPGMSGFEFCETVHQFSDLPIIMLTAVNEEKTLIEGLDRYAEDYIVKPFSPDVLVARVGRVLRRIGDFAYTLEAQTRIDNHLTVDFSNRQAFVDGQEVSLTPTETKLLYILMRNAGRTVTTSFILRRIWPLEHAYEDRLHVHMHRLRRKIRGDSKYNYIVSERGTGYIFQPIKE